MSRLVDAHGRPFNGQAPYQHRGLHRDLAGVDRPSFVELGRKHATIDLASYSKKRIILVGVPSLGVREIQRLEPPRNHTTTAALELAIVSEADTPPTTVVCHPSQWDNLCRLFERAGALVLNRDDPDPWEAVEIT